MITKHGSTWYIGMAHSIPYICFQFQSEPSFVVVVVVVVKGGSMGGKSDGSGGLLWTILQALLNLILALVDLVKGIFGIRKVRDENQQRSEIRLVYSVCFSNYSMLQCKRFA